MKTTVPFAIPAFILWGMGFCMSVFADQPPSQSLIPSEYRLGIGLAAEYMNTDARFKIIPDETRLGQIGSTQSQVSKRLQVAFCGELGATIADHYYLGLLVNWRYSGAQNTSSAPIRGARFFSHEFKVNHYTDIMLKPAYKMTPCFMLYGLLGTSFVNWRHTTNQLDTAQGVKSAFTINKTNLGIGLGVGCEYLFKKQYALSIDYTYHFFPSTSENKMMSYFDTTGARPLHGFFGRNRTGNLVKKVQPSFGTIAVRFSMFFQL